MNTPVDFTTAKLLKEKGFDESVVNVYSAIFAKLTNITTRTKVNNTLQTAAPTIAEVVMWLYEKHGLFIHLSYVCWSHLNKDAFTPHIAKVLSDNGQSDAIRIMLANYDSPTEAYEAAILYTLKNLI